MNFVKNCFCVKKKETQDLVKLSSEKNIRLFPYNVLRSATENFKIGNKIGRGGFGTVYKGNLRGDMLIAVKVLSAESNQGVKEFLTEIDVITNVKHPNLVQLIGCCAHDKHRILVYEYVQNRSLDSVLLGDNSERAKLTWGMRSEICIGTAKGLAYLHESIEPPIVHRDIKASNILLDENFVPKIGDFGLAKLFPDNITHITTALAGTPGYLAPEYAVQGQLTKKADVYSFGVLVLEIISGRSSPMPKYFENNKGLLEWCWDLYEEGNLTELVDPSLGDYPKEQVLRYIKVALFCTQAAAGRRPSMSQVLHMLSKPIRLNEKELTRPGIFLGPTRSSERPKISKASSSASTSSIPAFTSTQISVTELDPR
ncbi:hypothetical protein HPP92_022047 [Vanilla planifolia]|uniref:Protein kinase domain-containing protein n=1 Tax=Vanilla planifolia TaxID=51239 RepID=A0A835PMT8_VANPL|nr:hypothetical protein HPP92_022047 [Vanilla planifolia]